MPGSDYQPKLAGKDRPAYTRDQFSSGDFLYPGKLIFNEVTVSQSTGKAAGCHQWEQHIEQQHKVYSDGNPARQIQSLLLQNPNTKETIWEGSDASQVAQAYEEVCGCDLLPDNPDSAEFLNHFFMFKSVVVPGTERENSETGKKTALYRQVPTEYLGADYVYDKEPTVIGGGDGAAPAEEPEDDSASIEVVVATLDGMTEEDVRKGAMLTAIKDNEEAFKDVKTILGTSLRGGFVQPKTLLLDKMVAAGHIHIEDGVVKAGGEAPGE